MCDCYWSRCEETPCRTIVPVHIGDFCVPRERVHVRCWRHKPTEPGWSLFAKCRGMAELESPEQDLWNQKEVWKARDAYFRVDGMEFPLDEGHGIGPNDECDDEVLYVPPKRKERKTCPTR
jgi:hypothetical protein